VDEEMLARRAAFAALGVPVPSQPLVDPFVSSRGNLARDVGVTYGLGAVPFPSFRFARPFGRAVGNFFAPRRVGVHHSLAGTDLGSDITLPYWRSRQVQPSTAAYGKAGVTSSDQIPGMSYYWDATGRGNAARAATEGVNQPNMLGVTRMMDPADTVSRAMVVTAPRFGTTPDVNPLVQGGVARMYPGNLRITGEIAGTAGVPVQVPGTRVSSPGGIAYDRVDELARMVQQRKAVEAAKSAGKVSAAGAMFVGNQYR